ncbi:MAG TPA: cytochrome P460 family protein [Burkholderiales bacterium]|nr:cytochrome P460 family protein [Burkholderiales bacterium]
MKKLAGFAVVSVFAPLALAADIEAGKAKVAQVCAACHGANGVSVTDTIPNLAAQKAPYIETQLKAFKDGLRRPAGPTSPTATMAAIATQLSPDEMANVAAYFASLPGVDKAATKSAFLPNLAKTHLTFPDNYKTTFIKYHTINFPATGQVRYYYANKAAVDAARASKPLPDGSYLIAEVYSAKKGADGKPEMGADGFFVPEKLLLYTAMATGPGWGNEFPEMLRNGNWNYAIFTLEKQHRPGVNQAECLGCHKPLDKVSYVFTLKQLSAAGK